MSPPDFAKPRIPPLGPVSNVPDEATQRAFDWTGPEAHDRVMLLNFGFLRYGTNDKSHAAAICLSLILLALLLIVSAMGLFSPNAASFDKIIALIGNAFLFVAGIAVGQKGLEKSKDNAEH
jgi:peptidoglycan/LPS O-acetylase OafA/YrhL